MPLESSIYQQDLPQLLSNLWAMHLGRESLWERRGSVDMARDARLWEVSDNQGLGTQSYIECCTGRGSGTRGKLPCCLYPNSKPRRSHIPEAPRSRFTPRCPLPSTQQQSSLETYIVMFQAVMEDPPSWLHPHVPSLVLEVKPPAWLEQGRSRATGKNRSGTMLETVG